ncbi:hypothetical protein PENTCL1PPCAC_24520 [Pristionchus entomophagus]|uniref:G protein-coupled receptor n=1 Tax=Pristionchus entomophagus TaxID=358040 RepID=A0AAV5U788_9BILA|nr:hypothetical protein PENTCL1PPCAC_24520 [Pristionchus entomophagus]
MFIFRLEQSAGGGAFAARFISLVFFVIITILTCIGVFWHSQKRDRAILFNIWILQTAITYCLAYGVLKSKAMLILIALIIQIIEGVYCFFCALYYVLLYAGVVCPCGSYYSDSDDRRYCSGLYHEAFSCGGDYLYGSSDYDWFNTSHGAYSIVLWCTVGFLIVNGVFVGIIQCLLFKKVHVSLGGGGGHQMLPQSSKSGETN